MAGTFWDSLRAWADHAGLLVPEAHAAADGPPAKPHVPESVCDNCPICQAAATLDQVDPDAIAELAAIARNVVVGLGTALTQAADQRAAGDTSQRGVAEAGSTPDVDADGAAPAESPEDDDDW